MDSSLTIFRGVDCRMAGSASLTDLWSDRCLLVIPAGAGARVTRGGFLQWFRATWRSQELVLVMIREALTERPLAPDSPVHISIDSEACGVPEGAGVAVATVFDHGGARIENLKFAIDAVMEIGIDEGYASILLPLLGAGAGNLPPKDVAREIGETIHRRITSMQAESRQLERITFFAGDGASEDIVAELRSYIQGKIRKQDWVLGLERGGEFKNTSVLEVLQGGYSGAGVYLCLAERRTEDSSFQPLSPYVVKYALRAEIEREASAYELARSKLGDLVPKARKRLHLRGGRSLLVVDVVRGVDSTALSALSIASSCGDMKDLVELIGEALGRLNQMHVGRTTSAEKPLSTLVDWIEKQRSGDYLADVAQFYAATLSTRELERWALTEERSVVGRLVNDIRRLQGLALIEWTESIHGDLNLRNMLLSLATGESPRILLVDLGRFGQPGPLVADFARLEASIHVRCVGEWLRRSSFEPSGEGAYDRVATYADFAFAGFSPKSSSQKLLGRVHSSLIGPLRLCLRVRQLFNQVSQVSSRDQYWLMLALCCLGFSRSFYQNILTADHIRVAALIAQCAMDQLGTRGDLDDGE